MKDLPKNEKHIEIIATLRERAARRNELNVKMRREQLRDFAYALILIVTVGAIIAYWGRHGWPFEYHY